MEAIRRIEARVLCLTRRNFAGDRALFHIPAHATGHLVNILIYTDQEITLNMNLANTEVYSSVLEKNYYSQKVESIRGGLDGTVIVFRVGEVEIYTDILTERGRKEGISRIPNMQLI